MRKITSMKQTTREMTREMTRNIDPADAHDLLERVPRASLAFAGAHGPYAQPIAFVWRDGRYFAGIPATANRQSWRG